MPLNNPVAAINRPIKPIIPATFLNNLNSDNFKSIPLKIVNIREQIELKSHTLYTHNNWSFSLLQIPQDELKIENLFEPISLFSYNYDYLRFWNKIRMKKPFKKFLNFENLQIKSKNSPEPTSAKLKFRGTSFLEEKNKKEKSGIFFILVVVITFLKLVLNM